MKFDSIIINNKIIAKLKYSIKYDERKRMSLLQNSY
jgi:hypothetical protein